MGRSVYGIVTCGIDFGGELPEVFQKYMEDSEEDYFDFEEFLCHEAGHFYSTDLTDEKRGVWFKRREEIIETCPVEIVIHGWGDEPNYILAVKGTKAQAYYGETKPINLKDAVSFQSLGLFSKWCNDHGINGNNPQWLLASLHH